MEIKLKINIGVSGFRSYLSISFPQLGTNFKR